MELLEATTRRLDAAVATFVREQRLPGCSAGVVCDGALQWSLGYGFADRELGRRPDARTLYRIASISKTFTASAVLQLRDAGLLRLDDPLVAFVPEAAAITNPFGPVEDVTVRRLLLHTSGLQGEHPQPDLRAETWGSIDVLIGQLPQVRVAIPPDTSSKYSNVGYQLLGAVVERVSGIAFMDYVRERLLDPLGLGSTAFVPEGELASRCAVGYDGRERSDVLARAITLDSRDFEADGGLWSSVEDLAAWAVFQLSMRDDVLARGTREEMWRKWVVSEDTRELQGLCWYWVRHGDDWFVGHAGGLHGFITKLAMSPDDGAAAIVLLNGIADAAALASELLGIALDDVRTRPAPQPPLPPAEPPAHLASLVGRYDFPFTGETASVEWRDDALVLVLDGRPVRLSATADRDTYRIEEGRGAGEDLVFLRDGESRIDVANMAGYVMYPVSRPGQ
jgi:CubicO group peptidase (beta-lactamase class C family)